VSIELRPASVADLGQVVALFLSCWRGSYAQVLPEPLVAGMTDDRAEVLWSRVLTATDATTVVAVDAGRILGVIRFDAAGPVGAVHSLYVSPDAQGLGLGTTLLDHAVVAFGARGLAAARLWVFAGNAPSIGFYTSRGWLPDGATRVEPEFGEPELRLRRDLCTEGAGDGGD
jgi:ribosomal protein S18 acetylase RimI-like enzyme